MTRKILRDLEKKEPKTVDLTDGNLPANMAADVPMAEAGAGAWAGAGMAGAGMAGAGGAAMPVGAMGAGGKMLKKAGMLDLSKMGIRRFVITGGEGKLVKDIIMASRNGAAEKPKTKDVFFFQVETEKKYRPDRINETIRMAAAGVLMLFMINLVNVYQRGIVVKDSVVAAAAEGYEHLLAGIKKAQDDDFKNAEGAFSDAGKQFEAALRSINFLRDSQRSFFTREKTVDTVNGLLEAAKNLAQAGKDFSRGVENLKQLPEFFWAQNGRQIFPRSNNDGKKSLTERLKDDLVFIDKATLEVETADKNLAKASPDVLPLNLKDRLLPIRNKVKDLLEILYTTQEKIPAVLNLLGDRYPHRYMILLQNDTEARPTGGFIGSYMLVDLNDGYITNMAFHDVYATDGLLKAEIPIPEDIAKISKYWRLRDSNYSPDFAISGEKAAWFLQKEQGPSVDSVIAINQSLLADLLAITGPLQLASLPAKLNQNNYRLVLSYLIESKIAGVENPKKVLDEFITAFRDKLFTSAKWQETLLALIQGYKQKKLLMYSRYEEVQKMFDQFGMSGRVIRTRGGEDYLNVVVTSIGGNKSDAYITQRLDHNTLIDNDGLLTDEISIVRRHDWTREEAEKWRTILREFGFEEISDALQDILGRGENRSNIKIYVPSGSILIAADGIEKEKVLRRHDAEIDKTYFMLELSVKPAEEKMVTLTYQLPEKLQMYPAATYKFFAQNQPGFRPSHLEKKLFIKPGLQSYRYYQAAFVKTEKNYLQYGGSFDQELYLSALVGK